MVRQIDADAFVRDARFIMGGFATDTYWQGYGDALDRIEELIQQYPTTDAVEVVRCKDCKYYGSVQDPCHGRTQRFCSLHKGLALVTLESFCCYGERRTDG